MEETGTGEWGGGRAGEAGPPALGWSSKGTDILPASSALLGDTGDNSTTLTFSEHRKQNQGSLCQELLTSVCRDRGGFSSSAVQSVTAVRPPLLFRAALLTNSMISCQR